MTDDKTTAFLMEISPELRGCAIIDKDGQLLSASDDGEGWAEPARELLEAIDAAADEPATHAHIATGDGEVFMVREGDRVAVAVAERFTLASLVLFDLRAALHGRLGEEPA
ncbi:MAG: hypothetical protein ACXWEL_00375 [Solirubrobacterales bacterium]